MKIKTVSRFVAAHRSYLLENEAESLFC